MNSATSHREETDDTGLAGAEESVESRQFGHVKANGKLSRPYLPVQML